MNFNKEREVKKMFRKTWALVLTVALLISCLAPFSAFAADFEAFELKYEYHGSANDQFRIVVLGKNLPENPATVLAGAAISGTLEHDGGSVPFNSTIKSVEDRGDGNFTLIVPGCETVKVADWKDETAATPKHTFKLTVHPAGTAAPVVTPSAPVVDTPKQENNIVSVERTSFTDIAESPYKDEINLLNAISVLAGDPAGTFRPNDTISRAEMAAIIVRIYGMESSVNTSSGTTEFTDVPESHWAAGYINIASGLGVINGDGDGTFRPDDKVTYNEAVKMLVCVVGYGLEANERGGWPTGYLVVANDLDISKNVITTSGDASRETVAKLVANAIDVEYLEKTGYGETETYMSYPGRTLLSEKLKVEKVEDVVVTETYAASLVGEGTLKSNQVRVDDTIYWITDSSKGIDGYMGYPVIIYAKEDKKVDKDYKFIVHYEIDDEMTDFIEYAPEDIINADYDEIKVYANEDGSKKISYQLPATAPVFVNGVGDRSFDVTALDPQEDGDPSFNGKILIIDIDQNEIIDVLFVDIMKTMVVDRVVKTNGGFYILAKDGTRFPESGKIDLEDDDVRITIVKDGEEARYSDLEENDVVSYSIVGNTYNLEACTENVSGVVQRITGDGEVVIDDEKYEYSTIVNVDECEVGDNATLYLDVYGKIAYVTTTTAGAEDYAYLLDIGTENDVMEGDTYCLKVYTKDAGISVINVADDVTFIKEGEASEPYESEEITDAVWTKYGLKKDGEVVSQLFKFSTDSSDKIDTIEVAKNMGTADPADYSDEDLKLFRKTTPPGSAFYARSSGRLGSGSESDMRQLFIWKGVDMLFVPHTNGDIIEDDIAISKPDSFFSNQYSSHISADFTWYDADENGVPALIVAYLDTESSSEYSNSRGGTYMFITDVALTKNEDGKAYQVTGYGNKYRGGGLSEITITLDATQAHSAPEIVGDKSAAQLKTGDIITFSQMPNGKVYKWNLLFSTDSETYGYYTAMNGGNALTHYTKFNGEYGTISDYYAGYMTSYEVKKSGEIFEITVPGITGTREYELTDFKAVYKLDADKGTLKEIDAADIPIPEEITVEDPDNLPENVFEVDGAYYLCPKIVMRAENHGNNEVCLQLMYIDDGTFED